MRAFNKPTKIKASNFARLNNFSVFYKFDKTVKTLNWIFLSDMTDIERKEHPEAQTTGGILRIDDAPKNPTEVYNSLTDDEIKHIESFPNYDQDIFFEILGIDKDKVKDRNNG
jgi:hypothetical protein